MIRPIRLAALSCCLLALACTPNRSGDCGWHQVWTIHADGSEEVWPGEGHLPWDLREDIFERLDRYGSDWECQVFRPDGSHWRQCGECGFRVDDRENVYALDYRISGTEGFRTKRIWYAQTETKP